MAAIQASRRLAHFSTTGNAGGLIFRVRYGYGSCPAAMAAKRLSLSVIYNSKRTRKKARNNL